MKYFILAIVSLFLIWALSGSEAQTRRVGSKVAIDIYTSCVKGYLQASLPGKATEIREYIDSVEHNCTLWTAIWYETFSGESMLQLSDKELGAFGFFMDRVRTDLSIELKARTK